MRLVFGKNRSASGFDVRLVGGWAQVWSAGSLWYVQNEKRDTLAQGHGLGRLLARLFGVSIGVIAARVVDDTLGLDFSAGDRLALADFVDGLMHREAASVSEEEARS